MTGREESDRAAARCHYTELGRRHIPEQSLPHDTRQALLYFLNILTAGTFNRASFRNMKL
jgi:hypothetical protein